MSDVCVKLGLVGKMKNILVIDDHEGARRRITEVLHCAFDSPDLTIATTLSQARKKIIDQKFDIVVLDLSLPDGAGDVFLDEILVADPEAYVVIATIHDESERLLRALENGAKGYLLKEQSIQELTESFVGIQSGRPPLTPAITRRLLELMHKKNGTIVPTSNRKLLQGTSPDALSDREREVLSLLARGFSRPEIAGFLSISKHTVATHIGKIYSKLDVSSRSEAAIYAEQNGLA